MIDGISKFRWMWSQLSKYKFFVLYSTILGSLLSLLNVYKALISKRLVDSATTGQFGKVVSILITLIIILLSELLVNAGSKFISTYCTTKLTNMLQGKFYHHIIYGDWLETSKYHSGHLLTRITSDVGVVISLLVGTIPSMVSLAVLLISSFITLLSLQPSIAIFSLALAPVVLLINKLYSSKLRKLHIEGQENEANYRSFMQESVQNNLIIKSFNKEEDSINKLGGLQKKRLNLSMRSCFISVLSNTVLYIGFMSSYFLVFLWGAFNLSKGIGAFGTLTALLQLTTNVQGPLSSLAGTIPQIVVALASAERLKELESINLESVNYKHIDILEKSVKSPSVTFSNVNFSYDKNIQVLKNINFTIPHGEIIGLIGSSGEGKTTLIRLILSLIQEQSGSKNLINTAEKISLSPETRSLISYVPQGNTLFSGTIEENLCYGNSNATEKELLEALETSCALDFVERLPDRLDSKIKERGVGLSEGQAQRLAIARALLRKKPILILDEVTSALDTDTEVKILQAINNLAHKPTCILITHRTSSLSICNRVLKLENGYLHEIDNFSNLETASSII